MEKNMKCPVCSSDRLIKSGVVWSGHNQRQRYTCQGCHGTTIRPIKTDNKEEVEANIVQALAPTSKDNFNESL